MVFLALIYLAFISLGLPDSLLGSSWPLMVGELGVAYGSAGVISMTISVGTVVSSLFSHRVIRRFGTGKVTVVSVALTALALLGFSLSPSFLWLFISAIPLGLGAGAVDSGLNEFVAEHYKARHMSWLHCFWGVGAMLGPVLISMLFNAGHGWRSGYFTISMIQFGLVALLLFSLPMWRKMEPREALQNAAQQAAGPKPGLFAAFKVRGAPWAMLSFFLYTTVESSFSLWGASYLINERGIEAGNAAGWVSLFFVGITLGRFFSGIVTAWLSNEALIRIGALTAVGGLVLMLLPLPAGFALAAFVLVGLGLAPIFPSLLHQTPVYFGKANAQATMGLQMACAYTGVTIMPPLFGQLFSGVSFRLMPPVLLACAAVMLLGTVRLAGAHKKGGAQR